MTYKENKDSTLVLIVSQYSRSINFDFKRKWRHYCLQPKNCHYFAVTSVSFYAFCEALMHNLYPRDKTTLDHHEVDGSYSDTDFGHSVNTDFIFVGFNLKYLNA